MIIKKKHRGISWLEFELFQAIPWLRHGVFLRSGGVSEGCYESLNLSFSTGDEPHRVQENVNRAAAILRCSKVASPGLIHGDCIREYGPDLEPLIANCDGLATDLPSVALKITHADCQAAIFADAKKKVIANVHCGWRGSCLNIYSKTIEFMKRRYGSDPKDILAAISPSLGPQSAQFIHYKTELPELFWSFQTKPCYFDFWEISKRQLTEAGIKPSHIEIACMDTMTNAEDFFSHRRGQPRGANATFAMIDQAM